MERVNGNRVEDLKVLTSLRFFAAMMIVVLHSLLFWPWFEGAPPTLTSGVSFFFVLSGFILAHVYSSKPLTSYFAFLRDRAARIWPMHIFALVLLVVFVRSDVVTYEGEGVFSKLSQLVVNVFLLQSITPFEIFIFSWNSVSWSISTELFFYLVFPMLLLNARSTIIAKLTLSALTSVSLAYFVYAMGSSGLLDGTGISESSAIHANPLFRGFEFVLGIASWVVWDKYLKTLRLSPFLWSIAELAVIGLAVSWVAFLHGMLMGLFDEASPARLIFRVLGSSWVFALVIIVCASGRGMLGKLLSKRVFVFLGEISFSVYMVHMVMMKFFKFSLPHEYEVSPALFFTVLIVVSAGCYYLIEKPMQSLLRAKRPRLVDREVNAA